MGKGTKRNKPCPCGSGKKYKNCCFLRDLDFDILERSKKLKGLIKKTLQKKCYFSHENKCSEKIIKAHSIQNNRILKKISDEGYVVMFNVSPESFNPRNPGIRMKETGRRVATTFTGFCSYHDQMLFADIDNNDYSIGDKKKNFLFAFRALVFELYKKERTIALFESIKKEGLAKSKEASKEVKDALMGEEMGVADLRYYFELFKDGIEFNNYDILETVVLRLNNEHLLAVNSVLGLDYDMEGKKINDLTNFKERQKILFVNIFPQKGITFAILSWIKKDKDVFSDFKKQILSLKKEREKTDLLNNLIIYYIENFALSPAIWNTFTSKERGLFEQIFISSAAMPKDKKTLSRKPIVNLFRN